MALIIDFYWRERKNDSDEEAEQFAPSDELLLNDADAEMEAKDSEAGKRKSSMMSDVFCCYGASIYRFLSLYARAPI